MENEILSQLGVGGLIVVIIVRDVIKFLGDRKSPLHNGTGEKMRQQIQNLWDWHNHEDHNGVKSWYIPVEDRNRIKEMEKLLNTIARGEHLK